MGSNEMMGHDPLAWIKETPAETQVDRDEAAAMAAEPTSDPISPPQPSAESERVIEADEPVVKDAMAVEEMASEPVVMETPEPVVESPAEVVAAPVVQDEAAPVTIERQGIFELGEQLVISTVGKVRAEWMDQIVAGLDSPVTLNGAHVESIDTAGLQLVVALIRELSEDGVSWQWSDCSETLKSGAEQLGMREMIACV